MDIVSLRGGDPCLCGYLYEVISASEASNVFEFGADFKKSMQSVVEAARNVDDVTRKAIQKVFRSLFETMMEKLVEKKEIKRKHKVE